VEKNVREQVAKLAAHSWIKEDKVPIRGFVFDVATGRLHEMK
jgi:carbonic anhydrase